VVNTTSLETRGTALSNAIPSSCMRLFSASSTAKSAVPFVQVQYSGVMPIALSARNPPTPATTPAGFESAHFLHKSREVSFAIIRRITFHIGIEQKTSRTVPLSPARPLA